MLVSELIASATVPANIEADFGKPSPSVSFPSFNDTIQVDCSSINHCGTTKYKFKLVSNGAYLPQSIATISPQSSDIDL